MNWMFWRSPKVQPALSPSPVTKTVSRAVKAEEIDGKWRVTEGGAPVMCGRNFSDGGGLDRAAAEKLAHEINERRNRRKP